MISFFNEFGTKYKTNYTLTKIQESPDKIVFVLKYTDQHIRIWSNDWTGTPGSNRIIPLIKLDHRVELNDSGLIKIGCKAGEDYHELANHYVKICDTIALTLKDLNYKVALESPKQSARIFYKFGATVDVDGLFTHINSHLTKFFNTQVWLIGKHVSDVIVDVGKRRTPLMDMFFPNENGPYNLLSDLIAIITRQISYFRIVVLSIERLLISNPKVSSRNINNNITAMLDFLHDLIRSFEMVFRKYSDYVGRSGIFATFAGIGASIILVSFAMPTDLQKWASLGIGIGVCVADTIVWQRGGIRDLVLKDLDTITHGLS